MGVYAKINGVERKIGTCSNMYYLNLWQLKHCYIEKLPHSLNPKEDVQTLWFAYGKANREVFPTEFNVIGSVRPEYIKDFDALEHSTIQLTQRSGSALLNIDCKMFNKLTEGVQNIRINHMTAFHNGGSHGYKVIAVGVRNNNPALLIKCADCGSHFRSEIEHEAEWHRFDIDPIIIKTIKNEVAALLADTVQPPKTKATQTVLKFCWNGIKVNGNLHKVSYSPSDDLTRICVYSRNYKRFDSSVKATFTVIDNSDSMSDYFENERFIVTQKHPSYKDVLKALLAEAEHDLKRYIKHNKNPKNAYNQRNTDWSYQQIEKIQTVLKAQ